MGFKMNIPGTRDHAAAAAAGELQQLHALGFHPWEKLIILVT
jgi:hypothetical protein